MSPGDRFEYLRDQENPLKSPNTHAITALLTSGGALSDKGGYSHDVEQQQGSLRRTVTWLMKEQPIEFRPFSGETISTHEFLKRWRDRAWLEANPDHPITWMACYQSNLSEMRDQIRNQTPRIALKKGGKTFYITTKKAEDGTLVPDEEGRKFLERFG